MTKIDNLTPWEPGVSGNPKGKIKGTKNRSTIARILLETQIRLPDHIAGKLKEVFPDLPEETTAEYIMILAQIAKGISGDTAAFNAVMDSAYGKAGYVTPTQESEPFEGEITKELIAKEIMKVAVTSQDPTEKLKALDMLMKHTAGYVTARDLVYAMNAEEQQQLLIELEKRLTTNE